MDKPNKLYNLPLPGFMTGFMSLFGIFMPHRNDKDFLRATADSYLRETWQSVGADLRRAMNEYDKISSAWK